MTSKTILELTEEDYLRSYLRSREIYELDELTKKNHAKKLQKERDSFESRSIIVT